MQYLYEDRGGSRQAVSEAIYLAYRHDDRFRQVIADKGLLVFSLNDSDNKEQPSPAYGGRDQGNSSHLLWNGV